MEVNIATVYLDNRDEPLKLIPIGDIHYGNRGCNKKYALKLRDWIVNSENTAVIGMGDYGDFITHQDKTRFEWEEIDEELFRDGFEEKTLVEKQFYWIKDFFEPIADADKLLGLHYGNHDSSIKKRHHWDIVRTLCDELEVPYLGWEALTKIKWSRNQFHRKGITLLTTHGWGSAAKIGGKANKLTDLFLHARADIFLMGHVHVKDVHVMGQFELHGSKVVKKKKVFGLTGTFLDDALYARHKGYQPVMPGTLRIDIYPQKTHVDIHARV